jgi:hypothetical protein
MAQQSQDGAAPQHTESAETKHAGHTAAKPAAKSLKAGRAKD